GASGGPVDTGISGFLVKAVKEPWHKNVFVGIDAGTYMSGVVNALRGQQVFRLGMGTLPFKTILENAAYVIRELVAAVCITHSHLDHVAGFVLNSACFSRENPKVLAGRATVIDAVKTHIFNNVVWPNLTNEGDLPIGLVHLRRLAESKPNLPVVEGSAEDEALTEASYEHIANGLSLRAFPITHGCVHTSNSSHAAIAYESTAYFVRDENTGRELLMFGDVEPDSISINPRNRAVWSAAAVKFSRGQLAGIFIECSYPSIQPDHSLFGHLSPKFLIQELKMFAA
ncbi:cyclic-AMP phosphodiesterase, partial [Dipodascopsis uninucleata]